MDPLYKRNLRNHQLKKTKEGGDEERMSGQGY